MNFKKWWNENDNRQWFIKMIFSVGLIMAIMAIVAMSVDAAPVENEGGAANGIFVGEHMKLENGEDTFYQIDTADKSKEQMDQGLGDDFMDTLKGASPFAIAKENGVAMMNVMTEYIFGFNMMMTSAMIGMLNFGFNSTITDGFISMIEEVVQNISGLTGVQIGGGLFGSFVMIAFVMTAVVAGYQFAIKKSSIGGFQTLFKSILALAISFIMIANFGNIMRGMNDMATWVSASALTGTTNFVTSDDRSKDEMMDAVDRNMWDLFIGKPYLVMQYGTDDVEMIGEERINDLLMMQPGEDRKDYVQETEVGELDNRNMTAGNTMDRLAFTMLYSVTNMLVSIPVWGIAFLHIVFSFWFLLIAFLAPFALLFGVFPGQFSVLQRYAVELVYPLLLKILVSFVTVFIFAIGFVAYELPAAPGMPQYFTAAIIQFALFSLLFIIRKRIKAIFSSGNAGPFNLLRNDIQDLRSSMDDVGRKMGKGAKVAGAVAIGVATGGASSSVSGAVMKAAAARRVASSGKSPSQPIADLKQESKTQPIADLRTEAPKAAPAQPTLKDEDMSKPFTDLKKRVLDVKSDDEKEKGSKAK